MRCLQPRGDAILKMATGGLWSLRGSRVYFWERLLIAVSRATARPSTRQSRFIHIISAPLAAQTAFNSEENLVVPQGCRLRACGTWAEMSVKLEDTQWEKQ